MQSVSSERLWHCGNVSKGSSLRRVLIRIESLYLPVALIHWACGRVPRDIQNVFGARVTGKRGQALWGGPSSKRRKVHVLRERMRSYGGDTTTVGHRQMARSRWFMIHSLKKKKLHIINIQIFKIKNFNNINIYIFKIKKLHIRYHNLFIKDDYFI